MLGMILTLIKPLNAFLIGLFLWSNHPYLAALWIQVLAFCDIIDGILFRMSPWAVSPPEWWKTKFGINDLGWFRRVCDIVGDRIAVEFCLILAIIWYDFPLYLYAVELIRDLFLLTVWVYGKYGTKNPIQEPNLLSRIAMLSVAIMGSLWLLDFRTAAFHLVWVLAGCGILGAFQYVFAIRLRSKDEPIPPTWISLLMYLILYGAFTAEIAVLAWVVSKSETVVIVALSIFLSVMMISNLYIMFYIRRDIEELPHQGAIWRFFDRHLPRYKGKLV